MTEQLSLFCYSAGAIEKHAAARKQLLPFSGQKKAASDTIEKSQPKFVLEIDELPRQGRLGDPQVQGRLGDSAKFGHGYKSARMPQIHGRL